VAVVVAAAALIGGVFLVNSKQKVAPPPAAAAKLSLPPAPDRPGIAVLGDAYANGDGAGWTNGWVPIVADRMCWQLTPASEPRGAGAQSSTGFTTGNSTGEQRYRDRVDAITKAQPKVVIVEGGLNDVPARSEDITKAAQDTFEAIRGQVDEQTIIVAIGPVAPPSPKIPRSEVTRVSDAIAAGARNAGVSYINPVKDNWLQDPAMYSPDMIHPNREGYREYAQRLVDTLVLNGVQPNCT
jgi:acyl-CoA thioesterase I